MFKEKLISLIKEVPEIKSDLEADEIKKHIISDLIDDIMYLKDRITQVTDYKDVEELENKKDNIIKYLENNIGNPLEERHLRMYCESIAIGITTRGDGQIEDWRGIYVAKLDHTKSFDNQSEEVYEKIFNYLTKMKK